MMSTSARRPSGQRGALSALVKERFRRRLDDERRSLIERLLHHPMNSLGEADEDPSFRLPDQAFLLRLTQQFLVRLAESERRLLAEIDHALSKLEGDGYGLCERTGEPIDKRRLEARPWIRFGQKVRSGDQMRAQRTKKR